MSDYTVLGVDIALQLKALSLSQLLNKDLKYLAKNSTNGSVAPAAEERIFPFH